MELRDANLKVTKALPGSATNVTSTSIDTGKTTAAGVQPGDVEFLLSAPALTTAMLGDAATMKYDILTSDSADLSNPVAYITTALTQTGAGGAGAAASTFRFRLPSDAKRYVGFKATNSAAGNASTVSATLELLA